MSHFSAPPPPPPDRSVAGQKKIWYGVQEEEEDKCALRCGTPQLPCSMRNSPNISPIYLQRERKPGAFSLNHATNLRGLSRRRVGGTEAARSIIERRSAVYRRAPLNAEFAKLCASPARNYYLMNAFLPSPLPPLEKSRLTDVKPPYPSAFLAYIHAINGRGGDEEKPKEEEKQKQISARACMQKREEEKRN